MLSETQRQFVELEKKKKAIKEYYDQLDAATEALVKEMGLNAYFQDEEGTVYKTIVPSGTFVSFKQFSVVRTRRSDEKAGDLSMKDAEAAGFVLPKR